MVLIWGRKLYRKKRGEIADFCPFCRAVMRMRATEVGVVPHLYYIPTGGREPSGHEVACNECNACRFIGSATEIRVFASGLIGDVLELAYDTSPTGAEHLEARLDLESRARSGAINEAERMGLLLEPIIAAEYGAERERFRGNYESVSVTLALVAVVGSIAAALMIYGCFDPVPPSRAYVLTTFGVCFATFMLWPWVILRIVGSHSNVASSRKIMRPIARSLVALSPSLEELERAVEVVRTLGCLTMGRMDATRLHAEIARVRSV